MRYRAIDYWDRLLSKDESYLKNFFSKQHNFNDRKNYFSDLVEVINLETSSSCNRKCTYCPVSVVDRTSKFLIDNELFKRILSDLSTIKYSKNITLNLYNEPLMDAQFVSKVKIIKDILPDCFLNFNSNGDYLNKKNFKEILYSGADEIRITLHSDKKNYNVDKQFLRYKKFFNQIGLDSSLINEIVVDSNQNMRFEKIINNSNFLVMSNNWSAFGNDRGGIIDSLSLKSDRINPCMKPIREITIGYDGYVYPCCQIIPDAINDNYKIGSLNQDSIFDLYFSELLTQFKRSMFVFGEKKYPPCNSCADIDNSKNDSEFLRNQIIG